MANIKKGPAGQVLAPQGQLTKTRGDNRSSKDKRKPNTYPFLKEALSYAEKGFPVFPCQPGGKAPLGRLVEHGHNEATTDQNTIREWWASEPRANIGLVPKVGYAIVDIDPRDGGDKTWRALKVNGAGKTLKSFSGGPDGGTHRIYKNAPKVLPGSLGKGIQIKANGKGYVVAPPSVHPSGGIYRWEDFFDPTTIQDWPSGLLPPDDGADLMGSTGSEELQGGRTGEPLAQGNGSGGSAQEGLSPGQIQTLLGGLGARDYQDWIAVGQILKSELGEDGFEQWVEWSRDNGGDKFKGLEDCRAKWDSFKKGGKGRGSGSRGMGTLVRMAGGKVPAPLPSEEFGKASLEELEAVEGKARGSRLVTESLDDIEAKEIEWLVPDYVAQGMMHCVSGYGGAGKSIALTVMMGALSRGVDWVHEDIKLASGPVGTLIVTEEQVAFSLVKRLELIGANKKLVRVIKHVTEKVKGKDGKLENVPWNLVEHLEDVEDFFLTNPDYKLLVIDPIGSYMEGRRQTIDTWKDSDVRKVLMPWNTLAEKLHISIIFTAHFNKGKSARAADKVTGSGAFTTSTRFTYLVGEPGAEWLDTQGYQKPENPDSSDRVFVNTKCNIGSAPAPLVIRFEDMPGTKNPKATVLGALPKSVKSELEQHLMGGSVGGGSGDKKTRAGEVLLLIDTNPGITGKGLLEKLPGVSQPNLSHYIDELGLKVIEVKIGKSKCYYVAGFPGLDLLE